MRSPSAWWLPRKDWRELATSHAYLIFALLVAPLVGFAFTYSVDAYAELSGAAAGGLSPLDGIVVPTFGAYVVALYMLFPFAAIRLVSAEKDNGALALMLQSRHSLAKQVVVKFAVLLGAWVVAWMPGVLALVIWRGNGGHLYAPEVLSVLIGHLLRGALVISIAMVFAAVSNGAAAATLLTLAFTLACWSLDFVAQVQGGITQVVADLAPQGLLRPFERGEIRLDVIALMIVTVVTHLALTVVWLHPGRERGTRWAMTIVLLVASSLLTSVAGELRASWDVSEDRRNSFDAADERALRQITAPVRVEVNLSPEDPRLDDLNRGVLHKLRRALPNVTVLNTSSESRKPRAESREPRAEIAISVGPKRGMSRSTSEPDVLDVMYGLAGVAPPTRAVRAAYPGYPLAIASTSAPYFFYLFLPAIVATAWWWYRRPR